MISLQEIYEIELSKLRPSMSVNKLLQENVSFKGQRLKNKDYWYYRSKKEGNLKNYQKKLCSQNFFSKRV